MSKEDLMMKTEKTRATWMLTLLTAGCLLLGLIMSRAQTQGGSLTFQNVQVLSASQNRVCQHVYDLATDSYRLAWQSMPLEGTPRVRMGDIDNDGSEEIVASLYYVHHTEGSKRNQVAYYGYRIHVFEPGAPFDGGPSWSVDLPDVLPSNLLRDSWIGDVDPSHAGNELVVMHSFRLAVFNIDRNPSTGEVTLSGGCIGTYSKALDSIDVGDADNLGGNEIVVESGQRPWVWKWTGGSPSPWTQFETALVPLEEYGDAEVLNLTHVRVRDVDDLPGNEIISTGTNERLMVWRWQNGAYEWVTAGPDLVGNMAYGLDCGDVNGDGTDEVVIGVWSIRAGRVRLPSRVVALACGGTGYTVANTYNSDYGPIQNLRVADLTGDGSAEVILNDAGDPSGLRILRFVGIDLLTGHFEQVYAAPGDAFTRIEIR